MAQLLEIKPPYRKPVVYVNAKLTLDEFLKNTTICQIFILGTRLFSMNHADEPRQRYLVVFGKNAKDLEDKLNHPDFTPPGYKVTQLTFNSVNGEYLTILEDEWR